MAASSLATFGRILKFSVVTRFIQLLYRLGCDISCVYNLYSTSVVILLFQAAVAKHPPLAASSTVPEHLLVRHQHWWLLVGNVNDGSTGQVKVIKPDLVRLDMAEDGELGPVVGRAAASGRLRRQTYRSSAHFRSLLDGLLALRQSGILFDVVLLLEGRPIQAHRLLLAASCDYFR